MEITQEQICGRCRERIRENRAGGALIGMAIVGIFTFAFGFVLGALIF